MTTTSCPTPDKVQFATRRAADNAAARRTITAETDLSTYECVCGWFHLTKQAGDQTPTAVDVEIVNLVAALGPVAFADLVARELRGTAHPQEAAALRDPRNVKRWKHALHDSLNDIDKQLGDRRGDKSFAAQDWRKRAMWVRSGIDKRIREAKRHIKAANVAAAADIRTSRAHIKDLHRQAGEVAIQRLIDAHGVEFSQYLAEECERLDVEVPAQVRKYLHATDTEVAA